VGALCQEVGQVARLAHFDLTLVEVELPGGLSMGEVVDPAAQNAVELVEAVLRGAVLGKEPEVPLADQRGLVAGKLEP
jgi:hypothetical protein